MWKKFLASVALVAMVVTNTSFAAERNPGIDLDNPISNFSVTPSSFNPSAGDLTIDFDLNDAYIMRAYAIPVNSGTIVADFANFEQEQAGNVTYTWNGREADGDLVSNGDYFIRVFAFQQVGGENQLVDSAFQRVSISGSGVIPPVGQTGGTVESLSVSPSRFAALDGETTTISFQLSSDSAVNVRIKNGNQVVKDNFAGFDGSVVQSSGTTHRIVWDGRNSAGNFVNPRSYTVEVSAGNDTDTVSIEVEEGQGGQQNSDFPQIVDLEADPEVFNPRDGESTEVSFEVTRGSEITVEIRDDSNREIQTFSDYDNTFYPSTESHSINWDGTDDSGRIVADGDYTFVITVEDSENRSNTRTLLVTVDTDNTNNSDGVIFDAQIDPRNNWDPDTEELEIEFELLEDVRSLRIDAIQGNIRYEIVDDEFVDRGDFKEFWDGLDDDGEAFNPGPFKIIIRADNDKVELEGEILRETPEIVEAFVTKESFDPSEDEFTDLVFRINEPAIVTVEVFQGSKREFTLVDELEVRKNRFYTVRFDGYDEDGDEVDFAQNWQFRIESEQLVESRRIFDVETVPFDVEEDDVSDRKSNALRDYMDPVVFDEDEDTYMVHHFCADLDAEVSLEIFEGRSTGGDEEAELLDEYDFDEGCHTVQFMPEDERGKDLKDGIYTYKLQTKTSGSSRDTEIGRFAIGNFGEFIYGDAKDDGNVRSNVIIDGVYDDEEDQDDFDFDDFDDFFPPVGGTCGGFWDVQGNSGELCNALDWAVSEGITSGYSDGSFRPNQNINRAEVLKMVLEASGAPISTVSGSNEGFTDVDPFAWYMPYVSTGKTYGVLDGYANNQARLQNNISTIEMLKFGLESAEAFGSFTIPNYSISYYADVDVNNRDQAWLVDYAGVAYDYVLTDERSTQGKLYLDPANTATRGDVIVMLYRMAQNGILPGVGVSTFGSPFEDAFFFGEESVDPYFYF